MPRESVFPLEKNMAAQFRFADFWTDENKEETFGTGVDLEEKITDYVSIPTFKHGGGRVIIWACSGARGLSH